MRSGRPGRSISVSENTMDQFLKLTFSAMEKKLECHIDSLRRKEEIESIYPSAVWKIFYPMIWKLRWVVPTGHYGPALRSLPRTPWPNEQSLYITQKIFKNLFQNARPLEKAVVLELTIKYIRQLQKSLLGHDVKPSPQGKPKVHLVQWL